MGGPVSRDLPGGIAVLIEHGPHCAWLSGHPADPTDLVSGATHFVIVTADPSSPASACETYELSSFHIPVELQSFTID